MGTWLRMMLPYVIEALKDLVIPPEKDDPSKVRGRVSFLLVVLLTGVCFFFGEKVFVLSTEKHAISLELKATENEVSKLEMEVIQLKERINNRPTKPLDQNPAPYDSHNHREKGANRREESDSHELMIDYING